MITCTSRTADDVLRHLSGLSAEIKAEREDREKQEGKARGRRAGGFERVRAQVGDEDTFSMQVNRDDPTNNIGSAINLY